MTALARTRRPSLLESKVMDCLETMCPGWPGTLWFFLLSVAGSEGMYTMPSSSLLFWVKVLLYTPGWLWAQSKSPVSDSKVLCVKFRATTLSSFLDFRKFIWVNMINSKSSRYYNVKLKKKIRLVFQIVFHSKSIHILFIYLFV